MKTVKVRTKRATINRNVDKEQYFVTINKLRSRNFSNNLPFLILSDKLPEGHVYREFPDGRIEIQHVFVVGAKYEAQVLNVLDPTDADKVRMEYGLL